MTLRNPCPLLISLLLSYFEYYSDGRGVKKSKLTLIDRCQKCQKVKIDTCHQGVKGVKLTKLIGVKGVKNVKLIPFDRGQVGVKNGCQNIPL